MGHHNPINSKIPKIKLLDPHAGLFLVDGERFLCIGAKRFQYPFISTQFLYIVLVFDSSQTRANYFYKENELVIHLPPMETNSIIPNFDNFLDSLVGFDTSSRVYYLVPENVHKVVVYLINNYCGNLYVGPKNCIEFEDITNFSISNIPKVLKKKNMYRTTYFYYDKGLYSKYKKLVDSGGDWRNDFWFG